ncbi:CYTH domain-containing protein [Candidatus Micrarchaeota archaeon]|nr:CYTH domain-containing protein [Candidatus Micrarchaeota archaeon]
MKTEYETQILGIDKQKIIDKLIGLGAKETPEILQKRWVFDIECLNHENPGMGEWIRLRKVGEKTTITYKNKRGTAVDETQEIEIEVEDFEKSAEILSKLSCFSGKYYQENKRHRFVLENVEFTIDTWPKIPSFLEIEGKTEKDVEKGIEMLDLKGKESGHLGLINIYQKYGIDLHSYKEIKFD